MARSSNNLADGLLASAHDSAVHDGLRLAVPRYLEAADALVGEDRASEAAAVLAELLAAKEKKRGFLFMKRPESPLGDVRIDVARRYAAVMRGSAPTESSLDTLNQLALEYPDELGIRAANADALRQSGYLLDALDEYKFCKSMSPGDVGIEGSLGKLYAQLGRSDEAVAQLRQSIAEHLDAKQYGAAADLAGQLLAFDPPAFEACFDTFGGMSAEALKDSRTQFDAAVGAFVRADISDAARRSDIARRAVVAFEKLIARDRDDQSLWQLLGKVDAASVGRIKTALDGASAAAEVMAVPTATAEPVAVQAPKPEDVAPAASEDSSAPVAAEAAPASPSPAPEPPVRRSPTAGGLSAFAKRKALELFADSEYLAASQQLERVVKMSPDVESLEMLLECYLALNRHAEAARVGVQLADAELAAGNRPGAIATLTTLSKKIADPAVEQRRVELMKTP
jgi:tetratricopeptide (TPR) repeat protein